MVYVWFSLTPFIHYECYLLEYGLHDSFASTNNLYDYFFFAWLGLKKKAFHYESNYTLKDL